MRAQTPVLWLVPMRVFTGWVFLMESLSKLATGWLKSGVPLAATVSGWLREGRPYGFFAPFLRDVVLHQARLFSVLVSSGELLVGAALLAGLFSRWAALGGLIMTAAFALGRGDAAAPNTTAPFVLMCLTMLLTQPGRALGLDAALRGKVPGWLS